MSIPVTVDEIRCFRLMEQCSLIFNEHVEWSLKNKTYSKTKAHHDLYPGLVAKYTDIPTGLAQSIRDVALESVKATKFKVKPNRKPNASVRFDRRTVTLRGNQLTFSCIGPRQKTIINIPDYFKPLLAWKFKGMTLCYQHGRFWAKLVFETEDQKLFDPKTIIGIDRGISNAAVLSTGKTFSSKKAHAGQRRYLHNRRTAQAKGTPSARRRLKRLSGKEKRFSRDVNHCVTKAIANGEGDVFVLEKLQGIRRLRRRKKMNKRLSSWTFSQFDFFLTYKAQALGKSVAYVDARYTSQRCSRCQHTVVSNRKGSAFCCQKCGFRMHADVNAAINIRDRHLLSCLPGSNPEADKQGAVNHPLCDGLISAASHRDYPRGC